MRGNISAIFEKIPLQLIMSSGRAAFALPFDMILKSGFTSAKCDNIANREHFIIAIYDCDIFCKYHCLLL